MKNLSTVCVALLLTACASVGEPIDPDAIGKVQKGVTTKDQLIEIMGRTPDQVQLQADGRQMNQWMYVQSKANAKAFIPIAGAFVGGANTNMTTFQAIIDKDGVVQDVLYNQSTIKAGH